MKKVFLVCSKFLNNNEIFNLNSPHNRDDVLYPYYLLKKRLQEKGISLETFDLFFKDAGGSYGLLFFDTPKNIGQFLAAHKNAKKFLLVYESPIKNSRNQDAGTHAHFEKVFTWDKDIVDGKKYIRASYSQKVPELPISSLQSKTKLCCGIFGHKLQSHPHELYSERVETIRWFEQHHPSDFDLYGAGWDEYYFKDRFFHLNRIPLIKKLLRPDFPSYRGPVKDKKDVYPRYRFAICYENAAAKNYISEKIFDCFFCGTVPVYLGEPNIAEDVPENTFVDRRKFATHEDLYRFMAGMDGTAYQAYLNAIRQFLTSRAMYPFTAEYFADTISREIAGSL